MRAAGKPSRLDKAGLLPLSSRTNGTRIGTGINAKGSELEAGQANANVFFVGLMGAGKTTVGRAVARRLQRSFIDSDHEIEARTGARIPVIWEVEGEEGFRQREADVIDELSRRENIVLATGGGAIPAGESGTSEESRAGDLPARHAARIVATYAAR